MRRIEIVSAPHYTPTLAFTQEEQRQILLSALPPFMEDQTPTQPLPIVAPQPEETHYAREIFRYILIIAFFVLPIGGVAAGISYYALGDYAMVSTCVVLGACYAALWTLCVVLWVLCNVQ